MTTVDVRDGGWLKPTSCGCYRHKSTFYRLHCYIPFFTLNPQSGFLIVIYAHIGVKASI